MCLNYSLTGRSRLEFLNSAYICIFMSYECIFSHFGHTDTSLPAACSGLDPNTSPSTTRSCFRCGGTTWNLVEAMTRNDAILTADSWLLRCSRRCVHVSLAARRTKCERTHRLVRNLRTSSDELGYIMRYFARDSTPARSDLIVLALRNAISRLEIDLLTWHADEDERYILRIISWVKIHIWFWRIYPERDRLEVT